MRVCLSAATAATALLEVSRQPCVNKYEQADSGNRAPNNMSIFRLTKYKKQAQEGHAEEICASASLLRSCRCLLFKFGFMWGSGLALGSWTAFKVQVGIQVDSGLALGVQVGFKMGSGWVQVRLLRFRVGSGLAFKSSRWLRFTLCRRRRRNNNSREVVVVMSSQQ